MVKKGFLKKTGCILISLSIILTGWTFLSATTSEADYDADSNKYILSEGETLSSGSLTSEQKGSLVSVVGDGNGGIGEGALKDCSTLEVVQVAGSISIGSSAFENDSSLHLLECGSMTAASGSSFSGCGSIKFSIQSPSSSGFHTDKYGALYNGSTLVYVPAGVTSAPEYTLEDGTTAIGDGAFNDANITTLNVPSGMADNIHSIGTQKNWPKANTVVNAYGSNPESAEDFNSYFEQHNVAVHYIDTGSSTDPPVEGTYQVTIIEEFYKKDGTLITTNPSTQSFTTGTTNTITPKTYEGYNLTEGTATEVSAAATVTFKYTATTDNPDTPTPTPTDQYTINVTETFYNYNDKLEGSRTNATLSGTYKSGATIAAAPYTNYQLTSGNSPYTVTSNGTVTFTYKATAANAVSPISNNSSSSSSGKKYKITVYDVFYDAAGGRVIKTVTRTTDTYNEGDTFGYEVKSYDGYTWFDSENQSGTVYSDRTVKFFYKANNGAVGAPGAKTATGITASQQAQTTNKYVITKGAGQIVSSNNGDVVIVCNGDLSRLLYILVDGSVLNSANYTLASGSTILTLKKEYVASLPLGDHAVQFQYDDGYAITGLRLVATKTTTTVSYKVSSDGSISAGHTKDTTPKTADGFDARYLLCLAIFLLGAGAMLMGRQRKLEMILADREDY